MVLSPLLFSVFINAVTKIISSSYHLYADDLQLYSRCKIDEISVATETLNQDLIKISNWAKSFGLLVNPTKSQAIVIGSSFMTNEINFATLSPILYDNVPIKYTDTARNLGVIFDKNLSWSNHITLISKRIHYSFHSLKRLQSFLPFDVKVTLAQTLLLPLLDYADVCFLDSTEDLLNKLERLQNLCIRFIYGLRKYDHVSRYRIELKWLPIRRRHDLHVLCMLFNILNNPSFPQYLRERFEYLVPRGKPCRTLTSLLLRIPTHSTTKYNDSFTVRAACLWNSLPHSIRASPSLNVFRKGVKEYYFSL